MPASLMPLFNSTAAFIARRLSILQPKLLSLCRCQPNSKSKYVIKFRWSQYAIKFNNSSNFFSFVGVTQIIKEKWARNVFVCRQQASSIKSSQTTFSLSLCLVLSFSPSLFAIISCLLFPIHIYFIFIVRAFDKLKANIFRHAPD